MLSQDEEEEIIRELGREEREPSFQERNPQRFKLKTLVKLFKFAASKDTKNRDALCLGCGETIKMYKASRCVQHAYECSRADQILVDQLRNEESRVVASRIEKKTIDDQILLL